MMDTTRLNKQIHKAIKVIGMGHDTLTVVSERRMLFKQKTILDNSNHFYETVVNEKGTLTVSTDFSLHRT